MRRSGLTLAVVPALVFLCAACDDTFSSSGQIELRDNCDPATFNTALGAGACQHASTGTGQTFASFNSELQASGTVAAWRIVPAVINVREGDAFPVVNAGGEMHTYTEVDEFGGGVVPALNTASGNTTEAPECANQAEFAASSVASGQTMQHTFDERGDEKYQCCIHPWMRQIVHVR